MIKNYTRLFVMVLLFSSSATFAQEYISSIQRHLNSNRSALGVQASDIEDFIITNEVPTRHNNVTHVYAAQRVNGIPIKNAIVNAAFKNGSIIYLSETLEDNINVRATISSPTFNPIQAASSAASSLGLGGTNFEIQTALSSQEFLLNTGGVSLENVPVRLVYVATEDGSLKLAWDLSIHTTTGDHWWSMRVDATTGSIIEKNDWILNCTFESHNHSDRREFNNNLFNNNRVAGLFKEESVPAELLAGEQYNVYPLPLESPNHGDRSIITDPQDEDASPFGWHDINGAEGAEFTITRGNNVWAQEDKNGNNAIGDSPDGGAVLNFDFAVDLTRDAPAFTEAATTNLFYWNNIMHDIFYHYGFDEASGNFQETNYTGNGFGGDFVFADSQDGSGFNNASFSTPPDGSNPAMTMFLWNTTGEFGNLQIMSPAALAGNTSLSFIAFARSNGTPNPSFFSSLEEPDPIATLVLVEDNNASAESDDEFDGCDTLTNSNELPGNIAVIRRGACNFTVKVQLAQAAGAIGVIIVNNAAGDVINLGGESNTNNIPAGMIDQVIGESLITALQNGESVTVIASRPRLIDGDLDNGIIAHEYGHGISTRLTGGPAQSGCLANAEQMGEGWSDYFGMILTMRDGDTAEQGRGVGTFATNQPITGQGIRPAPYSTDTSINELTYGDTNNSNAISQPHGIGTVWATALWDMTWGFIDQYGFDDNFYTGTGGNNIALQLVVDALKLQPCSPGFVDGRDAILAAVDLNDAFTSDQERRDAKCIVYTAFAERGVGFSADQGSTFDRFDQIEAFDFPEGNDNFCNALSIQDENSVAFKVFPNPSNGEININVGPTLGQGSIKVIDINGRVVFNTERVLQGTVQIQTKDLATGVYLLQIQNDRVSQTTKIIVE